MLKRDGFVKAMQERAARNFRRDGQLTPVFLGIKDGNLVVMPLRQLEKDAAAALVQALRRSCTIAATIIECWMSVQWPGTTLTPPSERPDRRETLVMMVYEGEKVSAYLAEITRKAKGKPSLGPWVAFPSKGNVAGRFGDGTSVSEAMAPWWQ